MTTQTELRHQMLQQAKAEAWDEGFPAGFEVGSHAARGLPCPQLTNPYRTTDEETTS